MYHQHSIIQSMYSWARGCFGEESQKAKTKKMKLKPYQEHLIKLAAQFEETRFAHLSRNKNQFADALGTLALMTQIGGEVKIQPVNIEIKISPAYCCCLNEMEEDMKPWYHNIQQFIRSRDYTARADKTNRKYFRIMTMHCYLEGEILYKRGFDGTPLRYLD